MLTAKNTEIIEIFGIDDVKYLLVWKSQTYLFFAVSNYCQKSY